MSAKQREKVADIWTRSTRNTSQTVGRSPRLALSRAALGCARLDGSVSSPSTEHRVHDLADIGGKNCFAEYQESLELLEIGNS
jgi:hypothetical protein